MSRPPIALAFSTYLAKAVVVFPLCAGCAHRSSSPQSSPSATTPAASASVSPASPSEPTTLASLSDVDYVGRVGKLASGEVQYAWSGAGFRVHFSGRALVARMDDGAGYHTVILDGELRPVLKTMKGARRYTIVEGLKPGEHLLEVYRRTEPNVGVTTLSAIEIVGGQVLEPPRQRTHHMEIVGDSISCGYGNEGPNTSCGFDAAQENHYLTYGALLARRFDADLSTIAWSGRGVVKNYDGRKGDLMPTLYQRIVPNSPELTQGVNSPAADLTIVNLGTNDFSTEPDPAESTFVATYTELLTEVRRRSPNTFIITTIGPMLSGVDLERAENAIRKAVTNRNTAGDARVVYHKLRTANVAPGCDWHPNLKTHEAVAKELEGPIARALNW